MLRHALRRLLWTLPTLVGISIVTFLFLSYVPDPADDPVMGASFTVAEIETLRRERYLDLPRFLNLAPVDVKTRSEAAVAAIVEGRSDAAARGELGRLGGAALPYVLTHLDALAPEPRARVALALAPVARRMGLGGETALDDPQRAAAFWRRFWDDRGIEFRRATVRSAVSRLVRYGTPARAAELVELDTFVLDDLLATLEIPDDQPSIDRARALVEVAAHVTGKDDRIRPESTLAEARACVERWQAYWIVYRSDFVALTGAARVAAMVLETRYGKWALAAVSYRFGRRLDGSPVLDELVARAPITLAIVFGAIAMAYAVAVPLGAFSAAVQRTRKDLFIASVVLTFYAVPTAVFAVLVRSLFGAPGLRLLGAMIVLAFSLVAAAAGQQRSALASVLALDHVAAARARGASRARAVLVHGLRNALVPVVTLAALEGPMALSGAFVVERIFRLRGVGEATILAVQQRDIAWLMALSIVSAAGAALLVMATDLAYGLIDHRLLPTKLARSRSA
ncbi:MAG: ABC transporter permease [Byssovorax sp.]